MSKNYNPSTPESPSPHAPRAPRQVAERQATVQQINVPQMPPPAPSWALVEKILSGAPAWITIIVVAAVGYSTLTGRISNLELQATTSIADRVALHTKQDTQADNYSNLRSDLSEIKAKLNMMLERQK